MTDTERDNASSAISWTTTIAIAAHGVVFFIGTAAFSAIPSFIRIFEDFDLTLPAMTIPVIKVYAAFGSFWFLVPLATLGLFVADSWISTAYSAIQRLAFWQLSGSLRYYCWLAQLPPLSRLPCSSHSLN